MTTALITGAGGFVGRHLTDQLLANTDWNLVLAHRPQNTDGPCKPPHVQDNDRVRNIDLDLRAPVTQESVELLLKPFGAVHYFINLASDAQVESSVDRASDCWTANCEIIRGALELGRALYDLGLVYFLQLSSNEVYAPECVLPGHGAYAAIHPCNPYAAGKAAQEALAIAYASSFGLPVIIVNTQHLFGEYQPSHKFIPTVIFNLREGEVIDVYTDSASATTNVPFYRFLHCDDLAQALIRILCVPGLEPRPTERVRRFHVVSPEVVTIRDVVRTLSSLLARRPLIRTRSLPGFRPGYPRSALLQPVMHVPDWGPAKLSARLEQVVKHLNI